MAHCDVQGSSLICSVVHGFQQGASHSLALVGRQDEHLGHPDALAVREAPEVENGCKARLHAATFNLMK